MIYLKYINNLKIVLLGLMIPLGAFADQNLLPGPLVTADWLAENIEDVTVLDIRKDTDSFVSVGHIEDAVLVNAKKMRVTRVIEGKELTRMLPERDMFDQFVSRHGVNSDDVIVLTHPGNTPGDIAGAARLYWQFKVYGFDQVALLDGGNAAWVAALEDLTSEVSTVVVGEFRTDAEDSAILATITDVEAASATGNATLIDTRELRFHIGLEKRDYVYAYGHIPGSKNVPYQFLSPSKGAQTYLSKEILEQTFNALNVDPAKPAILYCNSAYECASVWFVLHELLDNTNVKVYDGSLHEWTMNTERPMATRLGQ